MQKIDFYREKFSLKTYTTIAAIEFKRNSVTNIIYYIPEIQMIKIAVNMKNPVKIFF
jgi:hypothetical protein